jgi:hypothetical protein
LSPLKTSPRKTVICSDDEDVVGQVNNVIVGNIILNITEIRNEMTKRIFRLLVGKEDRETPDQSREFFSYFASLLNKASGLVKFNLIGHLLLLGCVTLKPVEDIS